MPAIRGNDYAKGNDGGAPVGNDNAVGNDGGAPEGNTNAVKHHGYCDPLLFYHRLVGDAREFADDLIESWRGEYAEYHFIDEDDVEAHIVEHRELESEDDVRDAFCRLAALYQLRELPMVAAYNEGPGVEHEVAVETETGETVTYTTMRAHPGFEASHRRFHKRRQLELDLGVIENGRVLSVWIARRPDWVSEFVEKHK